MQLMRNLYLGGDQHTLKQKIIEAKLAIDYEKHHSKRSILTSYLNSVPYGTVGGQTAIGVQAAARIFFDKPASQLNLEQSALLAGLPQAPSQYNPFRDPRVARQRRNEVLAKMAELHYISRGAGLRGRARAAGGASRHFYSPAPRGLLLRIRARAARPPLRREDRRTGRAEGVHDDRPEHAAPRAQGDRRSAQRARRPRRRRSSRSTRTTATSRRWPSPRATRSRSTTSPPTDIASRARRSRRSTSPTRSRAGSTRTARYYDSHTLSAGLADRLSDLRSENVRGRAERLDQPRAGDAQIRQHRLRAAGGRPRRGNGHRRWPTRWASKRTCRAIPPRRSAGSRSA